MIIFGCVRQEFCYCTSSSNKFVAQLFFYRTMSTSMKTPVVAIPPQRSTFQLRHLRGGTLWASLWLRVVRDSCLYVTIGGDSCNAACSWIQWNSFPLQDSSCSALQPELIEFHEQHCILGPFEFDPSNSSFKPLILVPPTQACCGKALLVRWVYKIDSSWNNSCNNKSTNNYNFNAETDHRSPLYTR